MNPIRILLRVVLEVVLKVLGVVLEVLELQEHPQDPKEELQDPF